MRILIVEDDASIRSVLARGLTEEGFAVDQAVDGEEGLWKATDPAYDLIVLDLVLPKKDGLAVLRELRSQRVTTPVLILTARDAVPDRIRGLDDGADDYLVKPFAFEELLARLRALLRWSSRVYDPVLRVGQLALDRTTRRVSWDGANIELSNREFLILECLMQHPGEVLSRTRIYEHVWNEQMEVMSNVIDVHIKDVRRDVERDGDAEIEGQRDLDKVQIYGRTSDWQVIVGDGTVLGRSRRAADRKDNLPAVGGDAIPLERLQIA